MRVCGPATNGHQPDFWTLLKRRLAFPPASDATATVCPICEVRVVLDDECQVPARVRQVSACRLS